MPVSDHNQLAKTPDSKIEWPTLALFFLTYGGWLALTAYHAYLPPLLVVVVLTLLVTLHSSLQHEVIHGHPTPWEPVNIALAFPALGLAVAYQRYEILHLQHHRNWLLTDPNDDSESYFLPRKHWLKLSTILQRLLNFNNTLLGRLLVGPAIMIVRLVSREFAHCKKCSETSRAWLLHLLSAALILCWLVMVDFSLMLYLFAVAYPASSLLMLRAYGEHVPEEDVDLRSAIVKSNWLMRLLYLNNNYHRVHHDYPEAAWYELPELYRREYQLHTDHVYKGYRELFNLYGVRQRFPVAHPFLARD